MASRPGTITLDQFSESGVLDAPSEHVGRMRTERGYEYHCGLCKWEAKEEWKGAAGDAPGDPFTAAELDRYTVECIKRQILHKFTHQAVVWPDEVQGPENAVGRAWMQLSNEKAIRDGGEWRASRKPRMKSRKIHSWVLVEREEATSNGSKEVQNG